VTPALDFSPCLGTAWIITPDFAVRAIAVAGVLALLGWAGTQRFFPGRPAFVWMQAAMAWWLLASTLERASDSGECKGALALVSWPAILAVPVTWSLFVAQHVRSEHRAPERRWWWTRVAPLSVLALLIAGNGWHGLMYGAGTRLGERVLGSPRIHFDHGPLFWLAAAWAYALLGAACWRLLRAAGDASGHARRLWLGMLAISLFPMAANLAYLFAGFRLFGSDPTPVSFAAATAGLAWMVWRQRLFELVPLARRLLFTELADPVLVLDVDGRVMEANVAARQLSATVPPAGAPLVEWPRFGAALAARLAQPGSGEPLALADPTAVYEVQQREIGEGARRIGTLVQLHDVTAHHQAHTQAAQTLAARDAALDEAAAMQAFLREQAMRDPLTGLLNRRALDERFAQEAGYAETNGQTLALVLLDVDHFKRINDNHGHAAGDAVLRDFAAALRTGLRASDAVFRIGGEEFALLLPGADAPQAARRLQAVRERLVGRKLGSLPDPVTFSAGVAATEDHGRTLESLMDCADKALYQAKSQGRNRTVVAAVPDDAVPDALP